MNPIIIHPLFVLLALVLLWFPRQWLRVGGNMGRRNRDASAAPVQKPELTDTMPEDFNDQSVKLGTELRKRRNYIDLLRAGAGSLALDNFSFTLSPRAPLHTDYQITAIIGAIATIGVLIQMLRFKGQLRLFAPIIYFGGLSLGLCGVSTSCLAVVLIWAVSCARFSPETFLTCYAFVIGGFAFVFLDGNQLIVAAIMCLLVFLPTLLSLLMQKSLVMYQT